jgi:hypothetical protein
MQRLAPVPKGELRVNGARNGASHLVDEATLTESDRWLGQPSRRIERRERWKPTSNAQSVYTPRDGERLKR